MKIATSVFAFMAGAFAATAGSIATDCPAGPITLEPTTQAFVNSRAGLKPVYEMQPPEARAFLEATQAAGNPSLDTVDYHELDIAVGPTGSVNLHLYRPLASANTTLPVTVYFHGGGWIMGSPNTHRQLVVDLVARTGAAVLFVNYTRSPEAQFPVPIQQAHAAVEWLHHAGHAAELKLDPARVAFAGDSAGGAMAAAVNILSLRQARHDLLPRGQVLFYPVTDLSRESCTYGTFKNGPGLSAAALRWMIAAFVPNTADRRNPLASPLLASDAELRAMPETTVLVAEVDPLREEGEAFARRLATLGVRTTLLRAEGTIHDCAMLNALAHTPATRAIVLLAADALRRAFGA